MSVEISTLHKHETHRETATKFLLLLVVLIAYFFYLSHEFGFKTGGMVAAITWSFFVLCTPIADAGFLLDFPIRLLFGIRMFISEIAVWLIALAINLYAMLFAQTAYETTFITELFKMIILHPFPYWSIILLSGLGTFLSIYFGDEMLDVIRHRDRVKYHEHGFKFRIIVIIALFLLIFLAYFYLLESLHIRMPE